MLRYPQLVIVYLLSDINKHLIRVKVSLFLSHGTYVHRTEIVDQLVLTQYLIHLLCYSILLSTQKTLLSRLHDLILNH